MDLVLLGYTATRCLTCLNAVGCCCMTVHGLSKMSKKDTDYINPLIGEYISVIATVKGISFLSVFLLA